MNEFEQRLQRVPLKSPPAEWRAEILAAAEGSQRSPKCESQWARFNAGWRSLFWPHPQAWAGLAAVWVVIALLHFSQWGENSIQARVGKSDQPSPEMLAELRQQQQLLVELLGQREAGDADRPKRAGPHTEVLRVMMG